MTRLILFGAPGAGKGTQAKMIEAEYGFKHISTGDLIRREMAANTPLGKKVRPIIEKGEYVDDELIIEMVRNRVNSGEFIKGYVLDGFPRTISQARALTEIPVEREIAIYLEMKDEAAVVSRILSRMICPKCSAVYNTETKTPEKAGVCDKCGTALRHRLDDSREAIMERIRVYQEQTLPLIEYYDKLEKLMHVDASGKPEEVFRSIKGLVN